MRITLDEKTHTYFVNGRKIGLSVTGVLDYFDIYAGISPDVLISAADRGKAAHLAAELYDSGKLILGALPSEITPYAEAYIKFKDITGFQVIENETPVYDPALDVAGTLDKIGTFKRLKKISPDALCLLDIKCTYNIQPTAALQTAAYTCAYNKTRKPEEPVIQHRFVLQLKNNATYVLEEHTDATDYGVFAALAGIHNWKQRKYG